MTTSYVFDPTGKNSANLVSSEQHVVTDNNADNYYFIVPKFAPFFADSLVVSHVVNGNVVTLTEGVDYYPALPFVGATRSIGVPVYGAISFTDLNVSGVMGVTYQTLGGDWVFDDTVIIETMANLAYNPFTTTWEQVSGVPTQFPAVNHTWSLVDMVGETELVAALVGIEEAILNKAPTTTTVVTKQSIGLGQVENYPPASIAQALAGTSSLTIITPATLKAVVEQINLPASALDITALHATDASLLAQINTDKAALNGHTTNTNNPHGTTKAHVGLGSVENLAVITDAEITAGVGVHKYLTHDQFLKVSVSGGGMYTITIDLSTSSATRYYPVWWSVPSLVEANGALPEISLMRVIDDGGGSVSGTLSLLADQIGNIYDGVANSFTKVKFFNQPTVNKKFIRNFKHGMKATFRNKNKAGLNLGSMSGETNGAVSLCGANAGCFLRGGSIYQFTTTSLLIKNSLAFISNDTEREIYYTTGTTTEGGWYTRSYADTDLFLESDYPSMGRDDAYYTWPAQSTVYTFSAAASATLTWTNPSMTILSGASPSFSANVTLLPSLVALIATTKMTKRSTSVITNTTTNLTSTANGTAVLNVTPSVTVATGDVFDIVTTISRADTGDLIVVSAGATLTVSTPSLTTSGTGVVYLTQSIAIPLVVATMPPNTAITLRLYLVDPAGVKTPWVDSSGSQYTKSITTDNTGNGNSSIVFTVDGSLSAGIWKVAFDATVGGIVYTSTNNSAITIPVTTLTVPGAVTSNIGSSFSIAYNGSGFAPNSVNTGTPYLVNPSGTRVTFASATGSAGIVTMTANATGGITGNIVGTLLTTVGAGVWRVGLDVTVTVPGGTKTYSSSTQGTLTVIAVNAASTASLTASKTTLTAGTSLTYSASYAGLALGTGLYRVEYGTTLSNGTLITESIAVTPDANGGFNYSRVYNVPVSTVATSLAAYSKLVRISDNSVLSNSAAATVAIVAPAPTGVSWAPNITSVVAGSTVTFNGTVTGLFGTGRYHYDIVESLSDGSQNVTTAGAVVPDASGNWTISRAATVANTASSSYLQSRIQIVRVSDGAVLSNTGFQQVPIVYPVPTISYARTGGNNPAGPGESEYYRATINGVHGSGIYRVCTYWTVNGGSALNVSYETIYGNTVDGQIMDRSVVIPAANVNGNIVAYAFIQRISDGANVADGGAISVTVSLPVVVTPNGYIDNSILWISGTTISGLTPGRYYDIYGYITTNAEPFENATLLGADTGNGSSYNIANASGVINIPAEHVGSTSMRPVYLYISVVDRVTRAVIGHNTTPFLVPVNEPYDGH